jgi:small-conductance mechanosensitive channel
MDFNNLLEKGIKSVLTFGPKLVGAVAICIIGGVIIKTLVKGFDKILTIRKLDDSLKPFLKGMAVSLLKVMLVLTLLGMLGIKMTSFIAILGAAGLAVGMAHSGTLQNFAEGEEPFVAVSDLGDSSVNFTVSAWVNGPDYWSVFFTMNEKIYNTFSKEELNIPYPKMDVNVIK